MIPIILGAGVGGLAIKKIIDNKVSVSLPTAIEKQQFLEENRPKINIKALNYSAGAFNKFMSTRNKDITELSLFKDAEVQAAIKKSPEVKKVLKEVLENENDSKAKTDKLEIAQKDYEDSAKAFAKLVESTPPFTAEQLIQTMKEIADEGLDKIRKQHQLEKTRLGESLKDPSFQEQLTKSGVTDIDEAIKSIQGDLDKAHKTREDEFTKSTGESLKQLHNAVASEQDRIIFLAYLLKNNNRMNEELKAQMNDLRKQKGLPPIEANGLSAQIGGIGKKKDDPDIGILQLTDLKTIYTHTGKTIKQDKPGEFTLEMGAQLWNPNYYLFGNKPERDLFMLASAVKASGAKSIILDVNFDNPERAAEVAKQAYEAGIEAGFAPQEITVNVNGAKKTASELFGENSPKVQGFQKRAQEIKNNEQQSLGIKDTGNNTAEVKNRLKEIIGEGKSVKKENAPPGAMMEAADEKEKADTETATPKI